VSGPFRLSFAHFDGLPMTVVVSARRRFRNCKAFGHALIVWPVCAQHRAITELKNDERAIIEES
jgi:hypothetical protein